jgi:hypothetical protein
MSHAGDGCLTTYDPDVEDSVAVATQDLQDFWGQCVDEFARSGSSLTPTVAGKLTGADDFGLLTGDEIKAPDFDLGAYEEILVQPVPLGGG